MKKDKWKIWKNYTSYGELLYKRATGEVNETESSKSLCEVLSLFYTPGMKILDVGCGAGHYLRSFQKRLDVDIDYTGVDATEYYVQLARKAFGDKYSFFVGDIFDLPFSDLSFDIVICNNVILHLPPPPTKPIAELIRVSKKYTIMRTVFGERNYIIKEVRSSNELEGLQYTQRDIITPNGEVDLCNFFNMYTEQYIKDIIKSINKNIDVKLECDNKWSPFDNRDFCGKTATKVINGKQVSGNLILDWRFIILSKK